jgi:hypothetical protein
MSRVEQQNYGLRGDAFGTAEEAEAFGGRRFDVHEVGTDFKKLGELAADLVAVGAYFRGFGEHGDVGVSNTQMAGAKQLDDVADESLAIGTLPSRVGIFEVLADVAQARSTQEGVTQGMQYHVPVRVRDDAARVRNAHATQHDEIAGSKCVYVGT